MAQIGNSAHIIVDDDDAMQTTSNIGHRSMGNSCQPKHAQCLTLCVAEKNVMLFLIRKWSNGNSATSKQTLQSFLIKESHTTAFANKKSGHYKLFSLTCVKAIGKYM